MTKTAGKGSGETGKRGARAQQDLADVMTPALPVLAFPKDLPADDMALWLETVNTKTADYWSISDVPLLKLYCRSSRDINRLNVEIDSEGEVILNARDNPVVNPKIMVRAFAENRLMTLCTKLRLQPQSRMQGEAEASKDKRKKAAVSAGKVIDSDDDGLLAGASPLMQ